MAGTRPLILLLVHGIGPQNRPFQEAFLDRVRAATLDILGPAGARLADRLVTLRADWSDLYLQERRTWLQTLFPDPAIRRITPEGVWDLARYPLALLLFMSIGAGIGAVWLHGWQGWLAGTVAGLAAVIVVGWTWIAPRFPWGRVWAWGRGFEAETVSDIFLYESNAPRRKIIERVLDTLEPHLGDAYRLGEREGLPVLLVGHSLGSVVVYDALLGIGAAMRGERTDAQRRLETTVRAPVSGDSRAYLERLVRAHATLVPVGMVTFGAPVALFLFRRPELVTRRDLWKLACPPPFAATGAWHQAGDLRWQWQNFWHPSDFVAHRLEPLFNDGYPGGSFVQDIRISPPAHGPVSAHSTYWTDPQVVRGLAAQVAGCLRTLP